MYYNDHNPPHFHAEYGNSQVAVDVNTLAVIAGGLPPRATAMVMEWADQHRDDLLQAWQQAANMQPLQQIAPLQ